MSKKEFDPISKEAYRDALHKTQEELRQLRADIARGTSTEDPLWEEQESALGDSVGYYRHGRSINGHYWARFKWTQGPFVGRYCISGHSSLRLAYEGLQSQIDAVLAGKKVPPLDVGYKR